MPKLRISFLFVAEGPSDEGLIPHIEALAVRAGAQEVVGRCPDLRRLPKPPGKSVIAKLRASLGLEPDVDFVVIHRDADSKDCAPVRKSIADSVSQVDGCPRHVPIVPIQELEAWLLVDEAAIREVVGKPHGKANLGLPKPTDIENRARPKELLKSALATASEESGRRLKAVKSEFGHHRAVLLGRLDLDGQLAKVPAFARFAKELSKVVKEVL